MLHAFVGISAHSTELYKQRVFPRYRMKPGFVIDGKALPDEQYAEKIVEHAVDDTDFHPSGNNENDQQAGTSVAQMSPAEIIMNLRPEEHRMLQRFAKVIILDTL
ncbi:hypothetical protein RF11_10042 [Thelohanellus kitauei]|uniref:Uncharacterized protein n=1 Tax=Thelohanellus kitauei TaxID=669202 RepID=A0A0C2MG32_THEKT|nr:hypothetical protein RF11_10042 [Thelohanellus kitauei]